MDQGIIVTWTGKTMAPAPRLFFTALGEYQAFVWYNVAAGDQGLPL